MRIVSIDSVTKDAFLGKTIFDDDGRVLLKRGMPLKDNFLKRLKLKGLSQIYILDNHSTHEINDVIKPELRQKSIKTLKNLFTNVEKGIDSKEHIEAISNISTSIIDDILKNKSIMISLIDIKTMDNYTYQHSVNVAIISTIIGAGLKLPKKDLINLCKGALLHDVGKVFIPSPIIKKPSSLTDTEYEVIKSHAEKGYMYVLKDKSLSKDSKLIIKHHHEKFNGFGYPDRLTGYETPLLSRIVAVADVYDALTSDRPYRTPMSPNNAVEYIIAYSGQHFDPEIVNIFSKLIVPYPIGTYVNLSTGDKALVINHNINYPLRPIVKILESHDLSLINTKLNLLNELSIMINSIDYTM